MRHFEIPTGDLLQSGHNACPGCGEAQSIRFIMRALGPHTILVVPPSCMVLTLGPFPYSAVGVPVFMCALEAAASTAAGVSRAMAAQGRDDVCVVALAGDGGTYDIGLQSLSGAVERDENILYICIDNEGYMNTGTQKSSATPFGAWTASTPSGKRTRKKNLMEILAAHEIPYAATACPGYPDDLVRKVQKARSIRGMRFVDVLSPCLPGWGAAESASARLARLAVETRVFPLYEVEDGYRYTMSRMPSGLPVTAYTSLQKRYANLTPDDLARLQVDADQRWKTLCRRAGLAAPL